MNFLKSLFLIGAGFIFLFFCTTLYSQNASPAKGIAFKAASNKCAYEIMGDTVEFQISPNEYYICFEQGNKPEIVDAFLDQNHIFIHQPIKEITKTIHGVVLKLNTGKYSKLKIQKAINKLQQEAHKNTQARYILKSLCPVLYYKEKRVYLDNTLVIEARANENSKWINEYLSQKYSAIVVKEIPFPDKKFLLLEAPLSVDVFDILNDSDLKNRITYIEPNYLNQKRSLSAPVNDPLYSEQWYLPRIQASQAWEITQGHQNVVVAIIEPSGIDVDQADFAQGRCVESFDFEQNDFNPSIDHDDQLDDVQHGNAVAGVLAAYTNNNKGIAGVSYNCRVMPIKAGMETNSAIDIEICNYIIEKSHNYDVVAVNCSFAFQYFGPIPNALVSAYESMRTQSRNGKGVVIVAAYGNDNTRNPDVYPAKFNGVVVVGSSNGNDQRWIKESSLGSNYGDALDVVAPGTNIMSIDYKPSSCQGSSSNYCMSFNEYKLYTGTSVSAPIVSGVIALMGAANRNLTGDQLAKLLLENCDKVTDGGWYEYTNQNGHSCGTWNIEMGYGRVNAKKAVEAAQRGIPPLEIPPSSCKASYNSTNSDNPIHAEVKVQKISDKKNSNTEKFTLITCVKQNGQKHEVGRETLDLQGHFGMEIKRDYPIPQGVLPGDCQIVFDVNVQNYVVTGSVNLKLPEFRPDLIITDYKVEFLGEDNENPIKATFKIKNNGNTRAGKFNTHIRIRQHNWQDVDDFYQVIPSVFYVSSLGPNEEKEITRTVYRPYDKKIEDWDVIVFSDCDYEVDEANETNNATSKQLHIPKYNADIILKNTSVVAGCMEGDSIPFEYSYTIKNTGTSCAKFIFSESKIYNQNNEWVATLSWEGGDVLFGGGEITYSGVRKFHKNKFNSSTYKVKFKTDVNESVNETNENNNFKNVDINPLDIDLYAKAVVVNVIDQEKEKRFKFDFTCKIKNQGTQCSGKFKSRVYLKNTNTEEEISLGYFDGTLLRGEEKSYNYYGLKRYNEITPGEHYRLMILVDANNKIPETNESNNKCQTQSFYIAGADLKFLETEASIGTIGEAKVIYTRYKMKNIGDKKSTSFVVRQRLWKNGYSKVLDQYKHIEGLNINEEKEMWNLFVIPANAEQGDYYVEFAIDSDNEVNELNEGNNLWNRSIKMYPDLLIEKYSAEVWTIGEASFIKTEGQVQNYGCFASQPCKLRYYLYNSADIVDLGVEDIPSLQKSQKFNLPLRAFTIPQRTQAGEQYFFFTVDYQEKVNESDEFNNTVWQNINIPGPDIVVIEQGVGPLTLKPGNSFITKCKVKNQGKKTTENSSIVSYYLSTNTTLGSTDKLLSFDLVDELSPERSQLFIRALTIPENTDYGDYYILFVGDDYDIINEEKEFNNIQYQQIKISNADLIIDPDFKYLYYGDKLYTWCRVQNQGDFNVNNNTKLYYYRGNYYNFTKIGEANVEEIQAGEKSEWIYKCFDIPVSQVGSSGTIILEADAGKAISEANETNNYSIFIFQEGLKNSIISSSPALENEISCNVYPNPTTGKLFVDMTAYKGNLQINLINAFGQSVKLEEKYCNNEIIEINLSANSNGAYYIQIIEDQGSRLFPISVIK